MSWLTGKSAPGTERKSGAQLDAEIAEAVGRARTARKPSAISSLASLPETSVAKRAPRPRQTSTARSSGGKAMTPAQFFASLPPALSRRGPHAVNTQVIARRIRADLAAAIDAGVLPAGTKFSIRTEHNHIYVDITEWRQGAVFVDKYVEHLMDPSIKWDPDYRSRDYEERRHDARLVPALNKALAIIDKIVNLHNYDNSDSMRDHFDVGYYSTVSAEPVIRAAETGIQSESSPKFAALLARGQEASKALGPAATKSICGSSNLTSASEWCLERLIKVAARAGGRPVAYDKKRGGWFPI